jgi:hypothetical protein
MYQSVRQFSWNESMYCHVPVFDGCDDNLDLENIQLWSEV